MALGPGKYDHLADYCMRESKASAVVVIVFEGERGHGMSGKAIAADFDIALRPSALLKRKLPAVLREVARSIEDAPDEAFTVPHL